MKDEDKIKRMLITSINNIRMNPSSIIPKIKSQMNLFSDKLLYRHNSLPILTKEGISAFESAINYIQKQKPLNPLQYDKDLEKAAEDLIYTVNKKEKITHINKQGEAINDRVTKYKEWNDLCAECIEVLQNDPYDTLIDLIVSDGDENRTKRNIFFNDKFENFGIAFNYVEGIGWLVDIIMTGSLREIGELAFDYEHYQNKDSKNYFSQSDIPKGAICYDVENEFKRYHNKKVKVTRNFYKISDQLEFITEYEQF